MQTNKSVDNFYSIIPVYSFIYKLTNKINSKSYIGQAQDTYKRFRSYKGLWCKKQPKLYNTLKKYGPDNFTYEVIESVYTQEHADIREDFYINKFDSIKNGYNTREAGSYGKHSLESRIKLSEAIKGHPVTDETKRKLSLANTGKKLSAETIRKRVETYRLNKDKYSGKNSKHFGRIHSEETKRKRSESIRQAWKRRKLLTFNP